ncbi:MAG: molybdate ABC transporter substrate-binding protein [Oscillospiraceae bacterium]|nr:molybdate ABC transporter substrate-binding protein [Oscillospiraceae bacterium]
MKYKKTITLVVAMLLVLALFAGCAQQPAAPAPATLPPAATPAQAELEPEPDEPEPEQVELLIGAAMSLVDVVEALSEVYVAEFPHVTIVHTFASSGALQGQIEEGAPIDIFFSAAAAQMNNLQDQGLIYGTGRNVVRNTVALIVPADSDIEITGFADVALDTVGIVGVGDPEAMPIGRFAQEVFTALGVADEVYAKATLASDVRQILTWVEMGEVDAGVVFMTDAITSDDVRVVEVADSELHAPSVNPVGIVETSPHKAEAQNFIDFLFSPTARAIFEEFGFSMY